MDAVNHTLGNIEKAQIHISTYNMIEEKKLQIKESVPAKGTAGALSRIASQSGLDTV